MAAIQHRVQQKLSKMTAVRRQNADPVCLCCTTSWEGRICSDGGICDAIRRSARRASWSERVKPK